MKMVSQKSVLIETLWNVKPVTASSANASASVLIETLWNVKEDAGSQLKPAPTY